MNDACRRYDALIARASRLAPDEAAELDAHLAGCASCRELARAVKSVDADVAFAATGVSGHTVLDTQVPATAGAPLHTLGTDRYHITGEVGRGGIGRVLQALDRVLERPVALKELFSANEGMRRRFVREALITARLQHPAIVPVYDAGQLGDESPFYAMRLVAGRPLDQAIAEASTFNQRLALLPTVLAVADAIAYAHSVRVIHRDLKPTNILVGKYGETVVIDWGLAKDLAIDDQEALDAGPYRGTDTEKTVAGTMMGTPAYMAPEQASAQQVDERADVYALGAILYHVVSGAIPHEGSSLAEMVSRVVTGDVRPLTEREPDVPRDLAAIVSKAMALDPAARYPDAQGFADDLRRYLTGQLVASHSYNTRELVRRWIKRHRAALTVAVGALAIVAVVGVASVVRIVSARRQADEAAAMATRERNTATEALAAMMEEQGRQELLAGHPARAAVYLSEAQTTGHAPSVAVRSLLADAMRSLDAQQLVLDPHAGQLWAAAFSPDGTRILTAGVKETAQVWDATTGTVAVTLSGHIFSIHAAAFSPDGSRIATAGTDHTARLWDARTGTVIATFQHANRVSSVTFSPDGGRLVTTGYDGIVELWDTKTTHHLASLAGHHGEVRAAAFSPDGARVVTAGEDHTAIIWDANTGARVLTLEGHRERVFAVAFSPDGSEVVTGSGDHTARLWNARTGTPIATLEGHTAAVVSATFSPDGARVATASGDRTARLWDAHTGTSLVSLVGHTIEVQSARFSRDGARVLTASGDGTAKLWDAATGRRLASYEGHRNYVVSASFSPDGTRVLTVSMDGTARVWDATPSKLRIPFDTGGRVTSGSLSRDGARLVTVSRGDPTATIWDVRSGKRLAALAGHHGEVLEAQFDATGARIVTASLDHTAKLWDAKTGALLVSLPHDDVRRAAFSPDGVHVVTAGADGARLWSAQTGQLIARLGDREVTAAQFSKDGSRVVTSTAAGPSVWRTDTGARIVEIGNSVSAGGWVHARLSDDGERVVAPSSEQARIWDARTGQLLASLEGHTQPVIRAAFSPDGARVVTTSADATAKLWDARSGKLLVSFEGHTGAVLDAMFSSDSQRVVTVGFDHTARLWDPQTGKLLATFDGHTDDFLDATFTPDGTHLVTAGRDGASWIWDVHLEQRDADALHRVVRERDPWTLSGGALVPVR